VIGAASARAGAPRRQPGVAARCVDCIRGLGDDAHRAFEHPVVLLDLDPGQLAPLSGQLVAAAGEFLLLLEPRAA
jgi:hypothetical protein